MLNQEETIQNRLAEMKQDYIQDLPKKAIELSQCWQAVEGPNWSEEAANTFRIMIHSLAGTSGTFQIVKLAEAARATDNFLGKINFTSNMPSDKDNKEIEDLLNDILLSLENKPDIGTDSKCFNKQTPKNKQKILIINNNMAFTLSLTETLKENNYQVDTAKDIGSIISKVEDFKPELIIISMLFPDNDQSNSILATLKNNNEQTPIIYISESDDIASRLDSLRTGAHSYLVSPHSTETLLSSIKKLISTDPHTKYKVLVVEDEVSLSKLYTEILEPAGIEVKTLNKPLKLIETVRSFCPDLIFMDIYMPECSGIEAAMVLRQMSEYDTMPIVFISSETNTDEQLSAMNLGGDDFIVKPVKKDYLIQLANARLKRAKTLADTKNFLESSLIELSKSKLHAEDISKAKSGFIADMSHELRTPLNSILGFSQLLEMDESLTKKQQGNVGTILKAGWHLLELINGILDLTKIESGKLEINSTEVDAEKVISEVIKLTEQIAKEKNISVKNEIADDAAIVIADGTRLQQVILNILSNAIKYNNDNGLINIKLTTNVGRIRINISDTGIGIPDHSMYELFTPFNRLGAEKTNIEGNGIGLSICKQLVKLMNGDIGAYNNPESGMTFWIELPAALSNNNQATELNHE